jgi:hypothetical protein
MTSSVSAQKGHLIELIVTPLLKNVIDSTQLWQ